jgi:hypothetical protein
MLPALLRYALGMLVRKVVCSHAVAGAAAGASFEAAEQAAMQA